MNPRSKRASERMMIQAGEMDRLPTPYTGEPIITPRQRGKKRATASVMRVSSHHSYMYRPFSSVRSLILYGEERNNEKNKTEGKNVCARHGVLFIFIKAASLCFVVVFFFSLSLSVKKKKKPELRVSRSNNGHWNNGAGLACSRRFLVAVVNHGLKLSPSLSLCSEQERESL